MSNQAPGGRRIQGFAPCRRPLPSGCWLAHLLVVQFGRSDIYFGGLGVRAVALGSYFRDLLYTLPDAIGCKEGLGCQNVPNGSATAAAALFCWKPACQTGGPGVEVAGIY